MKQSIDSFRTGAKKSDRSFRNSPPKEIHAKVPIEKQIKDYKKFFEDLLEQWSDLFVSNFDSFLHRLNGNKDTSTCKDEFAT